MLKCSQLCTPAQIVVSTNRRTFVVLDSSACNCKDHLYTLRRGGHQSLRSTWLHCTASSRWTHFAGLLTSRWHSSDAVYQHVQELIRTSYTNGTYDQLNFGGVATVEELARQILICVDATSGPGNVSVSDSRFYIGSKRAGDALVPSLRRHVARQIKDFKETEPAQRRSRGRVWWNASGAGGDGTGARGKV